MAPPLPTCLLVSCQLKSIYPISHIDLLCTVTKSLDLNTGPLPKVKENISKQGHGGQTKTLHIERSSALDLWGDLDGFQTVKESSNHMCVYEIEMALINSQLQRQPADCVCVCLAVCQGGRRWCVGVKLESNKAKSHKVLGQSKPAQLGTSCPLLRVCVSQSGESVGYWAQRERERKDAPPVELCENSHRGNAVIRAWCVRTTSQCVCPCMYMCMHLHRRLWRPSARISAQFVAAAGLFIMCRSPRRYTFFCCSLQSKIHIHTGMSKS